MDEYAKSEIKRPGREWAPDDGRALPVGTLMRPIHRGPNVKWATLRVGEPITDADGGLSMNYETVPNEE